MHKILVFADSHGSHSEMINVIKREKNVDIILHAGDHARDLDTVLRKTCSTARFYRVKGNCDFGNTPKDVFFEVKGIKILMTHGNEFGVKKSVSKLDYWAREKGADIVIFGHTHRPYNKNLGDLYILNPGSIGQARGLGESYAVIEINERITIDIKKYMKI